MKRMVLVLTLFILSALVWAMAQQPAGSAGQMGGQSTAPGTQVPSAGQQQTTVPGSSGQASPTTGAQAGAPGQAASGQVLEGCLGGTSPNFTVTDTAGKTYKLNIPAGADATVLTPHVGESVQVTGNVNQTGNANSVDVNRVARGTTKCPGSGATTQPK